MTKDAIIGCKRFLQPQVLRLIKRLGYTRSPPLLVLRVICPILPEGHRVKSQLQVTVDVFLIAELTHKPNTLNFSIKFFMLEIIYT